MDERYRLVERLGVGGMSEVWRAHDQVLARDVAVKVLAPGAPADSQRPARIRLEARAAAGLRHPNIVEVYDYGEATDGAGQARPYVVMELVDGPTLDDLLKDRALPWAAATRIGAQVAAALAAAHARGVVHRDVKPGNVMVTPDGVKLVDFGISAAAGAVDETDGEVLGTPAYLAPERLDGGPVRVATDVYALGLLLYRALAGRLPWTGSTVTQMVGNHLYVDPAPLPRIAGLPSRVAELVRRCLAKRPGDRPSAAEAARILGAAVGQPVPEPLALPTVAVQAGAPTVALTVPAPRRPRRPRRPGLLIAAGVAAVAMMSSYTWWPSGTPRSAEAEASTVPSASAPASSSATPAPKPSGTTTDRPTGRRTTVTRPVVATKARPKQAPEPKLAPGPKQASKPKGGPKDDAKHGPSGPKGPEKVKAKSGGKGKG
ncbi:serine/threonine-protein kinase [Actinoplanes sp. NPDC048967]|uniref:serine/threonine-protein kinase n=1 Tax=Actinoplanes sp. NPDC048967 TaxID=3155269 RepID=UPI0033F4F496